MAAKQKSEAQNPLILRCQRLMEAFAKSDDERDFYLDRVEGFIIYVDLDKPQQDLDQLENELGKSEERYCMIPKLTFYETKKIMEGFVNEKVYDIDTKEKLLDIIQSKEARENFLDFIYDHHSELEKWQQFYQERSRIRIIEWLRNNHFHFVFEEDLDLPKSLIEKLKRSLFETKVGKDIQAARKALSSKAKTYYSNEALNPRPKRGRPPKQAAKLEVETQISTDIYTTVPAQVHLFLFLPEYTSSTLSTFSSKFESDEELLTSRRMNMQQSPSDLSLESLNQKLASLRSLSSKWVESEMTKKAAATSDDDEFIDFNEDDDEEEEDFEDEEEPIKRVEKLNGRNAKKIPPNGKIIPSKYAKAPIKIPEKQAKTPVPKSTKNPVTSKAKTSPKEQAQKALPKKTPLRSIINPKNGSKASSKSPQKKAQPPVKNRRIIGNKKPKK